MHIVGEHVCTLHGAEWRCESSIASLCAEARFNGCVAGAVTPSLAVGVGIIERPDSGIVSIVEGGFVWEFERVAKHETIGQRRLAHLFTHLCHDRIAVFCEWQHGIVGESGSLHALCHHSLVGQTSDGVAQRLGVDIATVHASSHSIESDHRFAIAQSQSGVSRSRRSVGTHPSAGHGCIFAIHFIGVSNQCVGVFARFAHIIGIGDGCAHLWRVDNGHQIAATEHFHLVEFGEV